MAGITDDTKLMLHCNGADESTTFTDDSPSSHTVTAVGTAQLDTSEKQFGTASGWFDGNSDSLSVPDSSDWDILATTTEDWTIDCWVKLDRTSGNWMAIAAQYDSSPFEYWSFRYESAGLVFALYQSSSYKFDMQGGTISDADWHHVCMVKKGTDYGLYIDGTQTAYVSNSNTISIQGNLTVGDVYDNSQPYEGRIDELRIHNANYFSAAPNVGLTDTITIPTEEYSEGSTGRKRMNQTIIIT